MKPALSAALNAHHPTPLRHPQPTCRVVGSYLKAFRCSVCGFAATNSCFCSSVSSSMRWWLMLISAPYWKVAVATGIHLAWSLPIPLRAVARSFSSCTYNSRRMPQRGRATQGMTHEHLQSPSLPPSKQSPSVPPKVFISYARFDP
jgi:hypothetical protein